jgi:hypothetical protein
MLPEVEGAVATYRKHRESEPHTISRSTRYVMVGRGKHRRQSPRVSWECSCGDWPRCDGAHAFLKVCESGKMSRKHWTLEAPAGVQLAAVCRCNGGAPVQLVDEPPGEPEPQPEATGRNDPCPCGSGHRRKKCEPEGSKFHAEHVERARLAEERAKFGGGKRRPVEVVWDESGRRGGRFVPKTREAAERAAEVKREAFRWLDRVDAAIERARAKDEARRERARARRAAKKAQGAK